MADPRFRVRQHTLYLPTKEDLDRWKGLAREHALTLNQWIWLKVEATLEPTTIPSNTSNSETVSSLIRENDALKKENESLWESLDHLQKELEQVKGSPLPLNKHVVDLLRSGDSWTSVKLIKSLGMDDVSPEAVDSYTLNIKSIEFTLETLESLDLIRREWNGLVWNK